MFDFLSRYGLVGPVRGPVPVLALWFYNLSFPEPLHLLHSEVLIYLKQGRLQGSWPAAYVHVCVCVYSSVCVCVSFYILYVTAAVSQLLSSFPESLIQRLLSYCRAVKVSYCVFVSVDGWAQIFIQAQE